MTYGKTQTEITISEVQRAVNALKKAEDLLDGNDALGDSIADLVRIIEECNEYLYKMSVKLAKEKYMDGKPLC